VGIPTGFFHEYGISVGIEIQFPWQPWSYSSAEPLRLRFLQCIPIIIFKSNFITTMIVIIAMVKCIDYIRTKTWQWVVPKIRIGSALGFGLRLGLVWLELGLEIGLWLG